MARQYDPKTGTWKIVDDSKSKVVTTPSKNNNSGSKNNNSGSNSNLSSNNTDNSTSTGAVEQEYNYIEINTLEGTVSVVPTIATLKVKVGDTVSLQGFGNTLSGLYYVKEVNKQINASGLTLTWTVMRSNFGSSLKYTVKGG